MMRLAVLGLALIGLVGGAVWLSRMDASQPVARVEKVVPADAIGR